MKIVGRYREEIEIFLALEKKKQERVRGKEHRARIRNKLRKSGKKALIAKYNERVKKKGAVKRIKPVRQSKLEIANNAALKPQKKLDVTATILATVGHKSPPYGLKEKMATDAEATTRRVRHTRSAIIRDVEVAAPLLNTKIKSITQTGEFTTYSSNDNRQLGLSVRSSLVPPIETKKEKHNNSNVIDCPNCTAAVQLTTSKCQCGYVFALGTEQMDSVGLSEEESTKLLKMFELSGNI